MTSPRNVAASELPESLRARIQTLSAASEPLAIEGDNAQIVGYIISPEQLQRLLEDAYTEKLLDEVHAVVREVRAERAAEAAHTAEQHEQEHQGS